MDDGLEYALREDPILSVIRVRDLILHCLMPRPEDEREEADDG